MQGAGLSFERADNLVCYPTAIKSARLRPDTLSIDETGDASRVKGDVVSDSSEAGPGSRVAPRYCMRRLTGERPIDCHALPFANRPFPHPREAVKSNVVWRNIKRRWACCFQHAKCFRGVRKYQLTVFHFNEPRVSFERRGPRIVPNRLLPGFWFNGKFGAALPCALPHIGALPFNDFDFW